MNNMTGDPSHETRSGIFGFDPYPARPNEPIDWGQAPFDQPPPLPPISSGEFNPNYNFGYSNQLPLTNYSFSSSSTPNPAQFPFHSHPSAIYTQTPPVQASSLRCKRKTEAPSLQACKQHITEEKMAEHMSKLHISSEMASTSKETEGDRTKRLYMCEEMRKLQRDTILPQALLARIQRPCTALVLWAPPRRLLPNDDNHLGDNGNNNEEAVPDNNRVDGMDLDQI